MLEDVEPLHGHAFFTLNMGGTFSQILVFDYLDRRQYYYEMLEDEGRYREEMGRLLNSMNLILKEEEVRVNGREVEPEALTVNLDFRGAPELPTLSFYIEFDGELVEGVNEYLCRYERGEAEYDYEVYWFLPKGSRILDVDFSGGWEVLAERILVVWVRRGERYQGLERLRFTLPPAQSLNPLPHPSK